MGSWRIDCKDILDWCKAYDGPKFHAMLCDPPYELGFMGKDWDKSGIAFNPKTWEALKEHLLPGAFIFVFGSSRGWHRLAVAIEDAGFVFHPSIMVWGWVQGQGFCKATRIDTQVDKAVGKTREQYQISTMRDTRAVKNSGNAAIQCAICGCTTVGSGGLICGHPKDSGAVTPLARAWEGHRYGRQALKPLVEMIICAQVPYEGKPFECITETGAGALWVEGARVGSERIVSNRWDDDMHPFGDGAGNTYTPHYSKGRLPPNFCLAHSPECRLVGTKRVKAGGERKGGFCADSEIYGNDPKYQTTSHGPADADGLETVEVWDCVEECAARRLGEQSGERPSGALKPYTEQHENASSYQMHREKTYRKNADTGTASRFFPQFDWALEVFEQLTNSDQVYYCAKAGRGERDAGLEGCELVETGRGTSRSCANCGKPIVGLRQTEVCTCDSREEKCTEYHNPHPTVKPIALARWLATLLLPPAEYSPRRLLVPFAGVMSEAIGAMLAGWEEIVGIEMEREYCEIGNARAKFWSQFESHEEAMKAARQTRGDLKKQKEEDESGRLRLW